MYLRFSDNTEIEGTRRELRQHCETILNDAAMNETLKAIAISRGLRLTADGDDADDLDDLIGKTFTFNRKAPQNLLRMT
jgi:hypothetical protein